MVRRASHDPRGVAAAGATRLALSRGLGLSGSSSPCDDVAYEPETSPFLEPYLPHFEEVRHVLDQFDDFALMPVEVPSRDIGRALAEHLGREGLQVHLFEISDWKELTARLLALPPRSVDPRPVLLLGPRERPKDLERALNFLNLKRDTLARLLGRPLLWCGLKFFLEATWDHAPDVWSIRDITIKIPLLAVPHTEYFVHLDPFVRPVRPPREIKKRIDAQRGSSDEPNLARDLLDYAHALIVRGRARDAGAPLNRAEAILRKSARAQTTIEEAFLRELRGDHAAVVQGESSAEGAYHVALDAYAETGDERGKGRVLGKLARIAKRRDEAEVAARRFEEALALADALGDVSLRAALLLARGAGVEGKKDSPEALADLDRAIALFESIGDEQGRARALLARTRVRHGHDDIEGATADVEAALAILGRIDDPVARLSALSEKVDVYVNHHNKPDQAEAMLLEARQIASRIGDRMARGWCLYTLGRLRKGRRDWTGAYKAFDEADTCFRQGDKEGWRVHAILQKSQLCHDTGRMDAAFVHSSEALAISRRMTSALRRTYQILKWHAHMLMHRDEHDRALELMDESIKDAEGEGKHTLAEVWSERAALRAAQGDLEGAWADFEKALAVDPQWHCQAPVRLRRADAFLRYFTFGEPVMGATDEAMDSLVRRVTVDLDGLIEGSDGNAREETAAEARVIRSMYLLLLDEPSRAVVDVEAAIAWFHASDKQSEEARALLRLTEIHLRHDGPGAADESLRRAAAIVQALGDEELSVQVSFFRVSVAGARGDFEEALQVLQQMRKGKQRLTPGFLEATMAQIHFRRGYITGARRYAERAMEQASKDTRAVISLMLQELLEPAKAPGTPRKA